MHLSTFQHIAPDAPTAGIPLPGSPINVNQTQLLFPKINRCQDILFFQILPQCCLQISRETTCYHLRCIRPPCMKVEVSNEISGIAGQLTNVQHQYQCHSICPVIQPGTAPQFKNIFIACHNLKIQKIVQLHCDFGIQKTITLMMINAIVSVGLNPGGCGFSSFSGSIYQSKLC